MRIDASKTVTVPCVCVRTFDEFVYTARSPWITGLLLTFLGISLCGATSAATAEAASTPTVDLYGEEDIADFSLENAKLRAELWKAEERISKLHDEIDRLMQSFADIAAKKPKESSAVGLQCFNHIKSVGDFDRCFSVRPLPSFVF